MKFISSATGFLYGVDNEGFKTKASTKKNALKRNISKRFQVASRKVLNDYINAMRDVNTQPTHNKICKQNMDIHI